MIQELYVNDVLMEVDEKFNIALLYNSMLFTNIENLTSNRSTAFSLPKTANNLKAIELSHLSDVQDEPAVKILYSRRNHKVDYYQNGVPIVTNALGVMMDISDRINFVFIFGNMENTKRLEAKMSELPEPGDAFVQWDTNSAPMEYGFIRPGFAYMDYGRGLGPAGGDDNRYHHPVVPVSWIMWHIAQSSGLTIDYGTHFNNMYIPLVSKLHSDVLRKPNGTGGTASWFRPPRGNTYSIGILNPIHDDPRLKRSGGQAWSCNGGIVGGYSDPVAIQLNGGNPFQIKLNKAGDTDSFNLCIWRFSGDPQLITPLRTVRNDSEAVVREYIVDTVEDFSNCVAWCLLIRGNNLGTFDPISLTDSWIWIQDKEAEFKDGQFPVIPNLPDMKQVEFLKHMMQLRGLFAYPKGLNHIGLISADELIAKKADAVDWTDKLITDSPIPNAPEGLDFKMNNFAQTNWFRYDNDEEVNSEATDSSLTVHNETIERERNALKLPFSGSKNVQIGGEDDARTIASIPLYDADGKMAKLKPRVLMSRVGEGGQREVFYEGLDFNSILNTYYEGYRSIVSHPRVIPVRVKLTDLDLSELDLTRPVYFEQFGRHYAILSVQAHPNGLCKCKLLEV